MDNNLIKIDCVNKLKKLVKWYKPSRYTWVKNASHSQISGELARRRTAYHGLRNNDIEDDEIKNLFSETLKVLSDKYSSNTEDVNIHEELHKSAVFPVSMGHILITEKKYKMRSDYDADPFSEKNTNQLLADSDEDIWVSLPLYMRDSDILGEVQKLLDQLRTKLVKPEPDNFKMKSRLERLRKGGVFEYLDLDIWAKANSYYIAMETIAAAIDEHHSIYPPRANEGYSGKIISDDIKRQAEVAITLEFSDKLDLILAKKNNNGTA